MSVSGTGPYQLSNTPSDLNKSKGYTGYFFFSGAITTTDSYSDNNLSFGVPMSHITIINEGANDLAYQWAEQSIAGPDGGVVKANSTLTIRSVHHVGIRLRSRNGGSATSALVSAT